MAHVVIPAREFVFIPLKPGSVGLVRCGFIPVGTPVAVLARGVYFGVVGVRLGKYIWVRVAQGVPECPG